MLAEDQVVVAPLVEQFPMELGELGDEFAFERLEDRRRRMAGTGHVDGVFVVGQLGQGHAVIEPAIVQGRCMVGNAEHPAAAGESGGDVVHGIAAGVLAAPGVQVEDGWVGRCGTGHGPLACRHVA